MDKAVVFKFRAVLCILSVLVLMILFRGSPLLREHVRLIYIFFMGTFAYASYLASNLLSDEEIAGMYTSLISTDFEIYWDKKLRQKVEDLPWGSLSPGASCKKTIYIHNVGSIPKFIRFSVNKWKPLRAKKYLKVGFIVENKKLNPLESTKAMLTLDVSPRIKGIDTFNFNIKIQGV